MIFFVSFELNIFIIYRYMVLYTSRSSLHVQINKYKNIFLGAIANNSTTLGIQSFFIYSILIPVPGLFFSIIHTQRLSYEL